eukprot:6854133-Prymnesium_polylepis.1
MRHLATVDNSPHELDHGRSNVQNILRALRAGVGPLLPVRQLRAGDRRATRFGRRDCHVIRLILTKPFLAITE